MLALRSGLRKALAPRALAPQVCSPFATGPRQSDGTLYEFRTYFLKPSKTNEFLENFKKSVHLRTAHSEMIGYWSVEFGGRTNKVFHIWKYDNFAHRTAVRKALANDKEWQERFLIPNLAFIDKQEVEITYLVPWCKIGTPPKEGVYELATFQMKPGGPALWGNAFKRASMSSGGTRVQTVALLGDIGLTRIPESWLLDQENPIWIPERLTRFIRHEDPDPDTSDKPDSSPDQSRDQSRTGDAVVGSDQNVADPDARI
ncbi:hypothetical protein STEG23_001736 [Scotinomys teguina]